MLTVTDIKYIRQEVNQKGRKYAEVARSMNHDERTVKKYMQTWKTGAKNVRRLLESQGLWEKLDP